MPKTAGPEITGLDGRRHYVKIGEAAEYIHCTERTIRQMISDGRLRAYRSGTRMIRLDLNDIDAHLAGAV